MFNEHPPFIGYCFIKAALPFRRTFHLTARHHLDSLRAIHLAASRKF
jgi:hypothetical protein